MPILVIPPDLTSSDPNLVAATPSLNPDGVCLIDRIMVASHKPRPIARYVNKGDIPTPPAPAWYLPAANDIYIHVDDAGLDKVPVINWMRIMDSPDSDLARVLGLYCHEAGHAAISDHMTPVQMGAMRHFDLLTLLEELRVENYALRLAPQARRFLRASFTIVLGNLPDTYENKSHVVRAWAIARGRTLAGVAAADETDAVDIAARTLLGDDIVDGLTDLLQEALTLTLHQEWEKERMVAICDEWVELVGETAEATGCTHCTREAEPGEEAGDGGGGKGEETTSEAADGGSGGTPKPEGGDDDGDAEGHTGDGDKDGDKGGAKADSKPADTPEGDAAGTWGQAGADTDGGDPDAAGGDALTDEDAELMSMLTRDLAGLMQDEWTRELDGAQLSNAAEWAARIFGNRKVSTRITQDEPTGEMRQHVVQVAQRAVAPGVADRSRRSPRRRRCRQDGCARGRRCAASRSGRRDAWCRPRPWRGTVRRHTTARPLVVGVATDTSGSMRWAEEGVAEFAYVYTNAGHRIGARTAAVTFGDHVHRIARPGEVMTHVQRKTASDGSEAFDKAIAALDGVLHLTDPAYAARILLVISDGAFVRDQEPEKAQEWLRRMDKVGTHVLWIGDRTVGGSYSTWLSRLSKKLSNLTMVDVETAYSRRRSPTRGVFDILNTAALEAIKAHVA